MQFNGGEGTACGGEPKWVVERRWTRRNCEALCRGGEALQSVGRSTFRTPGENHQALTVSGGAGGEGKSQERAKESNIRRKGTARRLKKRFTEKRMELDCKTLLLGSVIKRKGWIKRESK